MESNHASSISSPAKGGGRSPCCQAWWDKGQRAQGRLEEHVRLDEEKELDDMASTKRKGKPEHKSKKS